MLLVGLGEQPEHGAPPVSCCRARKPRVHPGSCSRGVATSHRASTRAREASSSEAPALKPLGKERNCMRIELVAVVGGSRVKAGGKSSFNSLKQRGKVPELLPTVCRQQKTTATISFSALFLVLIRAEVRPGAKWAPKGGRHQQPCAKRRGHRSASAWDGSVPLALGSLCPRRLDGGCGWCGMICSLLLTPPHLSTLQSMTKERCDRVLSAAIYTPRSGVERGRVCRHQAGFQK